jgi:hypothetical protein
MYRGSIFTESKGGTAVSFGYTIHVFDEALVIAPLDSFVRTRFMAGQIPVAGIFIGWISSAFAKKRKAEVEHQIEELPPDTTVEQLGERIEHSHAVPTDDIALVLVRTRFFVDKPYLRIRFASRDVDRYAYKRLTRQRQTVESDPESAQALLSDVFGDRITHKSLTWAKSGPVGQLLGRGRAKARE